MFHRITTLLVICALLVIGGATLAQQPTVFCGDLSEADCALITQASTATASLQSGSIDFSLNLNMTNIPDAPAALNISVSGNGSASGMGAFKSLADVSPDADLATVIPQLLNALEAFNGDLNLNITVPAELAEGGPNSVDLNLLWINGTGYINFDALQPVTNDPSLTGWGGLEIVALVRAALEQQPELLDQLGEMSAMSGAEMMGGGGFDPAMIERFSDPEFAGQYMTITRAADENGLAVFETTLDFGALYNDPAFQELMQQQMESQMEMGDSDMTAAEMEEALALANQMFENATFTIREAIDPATGYTNNVSGAVVFDMTSMLESAGESTDGPVVFSMDFNLAFSEQDSAALVTAPADAQLFPYQMLLGMLSPQPQ